MMPTAPPPDLLRSLVDASLLEEWQVEEAARSMTPECTADPVQLTDELKRRGWLTGFQTERILEGAASELVIGQYVLLEILGEGGMGRVYKALHKRLDRLVALKTIRAECLAKESTALSRFQREARAAAQLNHPNIVTLYDFDEAGGIHFLAMEYVHGEELARLVKRDGPMSIADGCECIRQAALGLQHAFEQGMVHRDLKPSNLFALDPQAAKKSGILKRRPENDSVNLGQAPPPGSSAKLPQGAVIKILDMGLVRMIDPLGEQQSTLTQEGKLFGTPDYIAPEQARDARAADVRSDLYSLGCTLYYLLSGRPPFVGGGTVLEKLMMHQLDEPPRLEEVRPDVPVEVGDLVRKLMAKKPEERFQTPDEFVGALMAVRAAPPPAAPVVPRVIPESPTPMEGVPTVRMPSVTDDTPFSKTVPEPAKKIGDYRGHQGWVMALSFTADRKQLASGGMDGNVRLWGFSREAKEKETLPVPSRVEVHALAFSPDRCLLAAGAGTLAGTIWLWDQRAAVTKPTLSLHGHQAPVECITFCPVGKLLASGSCDRTVRVWDVVGPRPRELSVLQGHADLIKAVAFSPDSKLLASAGNDGTVFLWGFGKLWYEKRAAFECHTGGVLAVQFSPDARHFATGGLDQKVRIWELKNGTVDLQSGASMSGHEAIVRSVHFTPDGRHLLSVDAKGLVILWDVATRKRLFDWRLRMGSLSCCHAFTWDGRYLATGFSDGSILVHRLPFREMNL